MTPDLGPVFHKFFTPDQGPKVKRRILPESTPVTGSGPTYAIFMIICFVAYTCFAWLIVRNIKPIALRVGGSVAKWYYIYTKFENFGIFSKRLVYKFLIWYICKICYIFVIFLSHGIVEILNQFIWFITKRKQRNRKQVVQVLKLYKKVLLFCLTITWEYACT